VIASHVGKAKKAFVALAPASVIVFVRAASSGKFLFRGYVFTPLARPIVVITGHTEEAVAVLVIAVFGSMAVMAVFVGAPAEVPEPGEMRGNWLMCPPLHGYSDGFNIWCVPGNGEV